MKPIKVSVVMKNSLPQYTLEQKKENFQRIKAFINNQPKYKEGKYLESLQNAIFMLRDALPDQKIDSIIQEMTGEVFYLDLNDFDQDNLTNDILLQNEDEKAESLEDLAAHQTANAIDTDIYSTLLQQINKTEQIKNKDASISDKRDNQSNINNKTEAAYNYADTLKNFENYDLLIASKLSLIESKKIITILFIVH